MLLNEIYLVEFKEVIDVRHEDLSHKHKFFGSSKNSDFIDPKDGYHFTYHNGLLILSSTANDVYDFRAKYDVPQDYSDAQKFYKNKPELKDIESKISRAWNQLGGKVNLVEKTITFAKESVGDSYRTRIMANIKLLKKVLKELMKFGVTKEFKIKGLQPTLNKSVADILGMEDVVDSIFGGKDISKMKFYHGTSLSKWEKIQKEGLKPGKYDEIYVDLIPRYSELNVYVSTQPKTAEFYGKRQAKKDKESAYVVIEITGLDPAKFLPDDHFVARDFDNKVKDHGYEKPTANLRDPKQVAIGTKSGLRELDSVAYRGAIAPTKIKLLKQYKA